jgi:hypothetical protein
MRELSLSTLILSVPVQNISAAEFAARSVDGLKRPVEGVVVNVVWHSSDKKATITTITLLKAYSDSKGMVRGVYDERAISPDGYTCVELSKKGYAPYLHHTGRFDSEYVLERAFGTSDLLRIAKLDEHSRKQELKEIMEGDFRDDFLDRKLFEMEHVFRQALRELVQDPQVGLLAIVTLARIGVPEDLVWVVRHVPSPRKEWLENRWACEVVSAMVEPSTEAEWAFIETCARGDYDDPAVEDDAIRTLRLIASPRSCQVLEAMHPKDQDLAASVVEALTYIRSKPAPLSGRDLEALGRKVASQSAVGKLLDCTAPEYNERRDKALINMEFGLARESITFTATFHAVGGFWKLRGIRLFSLGTLAQPVEVERKENL